MRNIIFGRVRFAEDPAAASRHSLLSSGSRALRRPADLSGSYQMGIQPTDRTAPKHFCRTGLVVLVVLVCGGLLDPALAVSAEPPAGKLIQPPGQELQVLPADGTAPVPLRTVNRLKFPVRPVMSEARGPLRLFELTTGEVLAGDLLQISQQTITVRFAGREFQLPRKYVRRIAACGPYADEFQEDFALPNAAWQPEPDASLLVRVPLRRSARSAARPPDSTAAAGRPVPADMPAARPLPQLHQLNLPASGLRTTIPLPRPMTAGRVAFDLLQPPRVQQDSTGTERGTDLTEWGIELEFTPTPQPATARLDGAPQAGSAKEEQGTQQQNESADTRLIVRCHSRFGLYGLEVQSRGQPLLQREHLQPLRLRAGPVRLTCLLTEDRLTVLLDDLLLAQLKSTTARPPRLTALTLYREPRDAAAAGRPSEETTLPAVRGLTVQRRLNDVPPSRLTLPGSSGVVLARGTEMYGNLTFLDGASPKFDDSDPSRQNAGLHQFLQLENSAGTFRMGWAQLHSMQWPWPAERPVPSRQVRGIVARLIFQPLADVPVVPPRQISAALTGVIEWRGRTLLKLQHPLLGGLVLPLDCLREIRPQFTGTRLLLAAGPYHLGESLQPEFEQAQPYGTRLTGGFRLNQLPAGPAFLRITQAGVEAAGPEAPPGSPYLGELRRGGLLTEVLFNNRVLGTVNSQLRFRSRPGEPADIRIPVPAELLRAGINRWQIRQQPDSRNRRSYDDCEIGPISLELESAAPAAGLKTTR